MNVRRPCIFLEVSIDEGSRWGVFEPNEHATRDRVTRSASNFLPSIWHPGAFLGSTPEEAFLVRCDRTTMAQDDIDSGV